MSGNDICELLLCCLFIFDDSEEISYGSLNNQHENKSKNKKLYEKNKDDSYDELPSYSEIT